jgi:hypothetical protein
MWRRITKERKMTERKHKKCAFFKEDLDASSEDVSEEDFNIHSENDSIYGRY